MKRTNVDAFNYEFYNNNNNNIKGTNDTHLSRLLGMTIPIFAPIFYEHAMTMYDSYYRDRYI